MFWVYDKCARFFSLVVIEKWQAKLLPGNWGFWQRDLIEISDNLVFSPEIVNLVNTALISYLVIVNNLGMASRSDEVRRIFFHVKINKMFKLCVKEVVIEVLDFDTSIFKPFWIIYWVSTCLLYTSPSPRDGLLSRMPSSA